MLAQLLVIEKNLVVYPFLDNLFQHFLALLLCIVSYILMLSQLY